MSTHLRRAFHQAVDLICDALEQEAAASAAPAKKRRGSVTPPALPMPELSPEKRAALEAQLDRQLAKAGYRKAG